MFVALSFSGDWTERLNDKKRSQSNKSQVLKLSRHLPEKVKDDVQLKNMSGQWFYEAKSKRHRDKIHGADIIRASMRRKPATLAEVSQSKSNKAKDSWVSNVNKEVFAPPELHGIVEHQEEEEELKSSSSALETSQAFLRRPSILHVGKKQNMWISEEKNM
ncbi:synaptotagmin-like protein 2 isoform X2 [Meleagris gallopavo]|uniref:synaptotagmin-like protein 2 isoform X2 n=1 Tax=Meleagris gallopavo TaxID=9103 RepID=UPI0012AB900D|nr:synaptotagmin-like protein 2 isoform X2 [Meleagris gallopavo]